MDTDFKREERYIVFKLADVEKDFFPSEISQLLRLAETQQTMRKQSGKPPLECVVVEKDWPEYEPTWRAIEARVTGAPYPGMAEAFEHHFSQPFKDGEWHVASRTWAAAWKAAKHHARANVPDGWQLVPKKITPHMGHAGESELDDNGSMQAIWDAMLAAAPEARP